MQKTLTRENLGYSGDRQESLVYLTLTCEGQMARYKFGERTVDIIGDGKTSNSES